MNTANYDPAALVQQFRPIYRLHSEEMWYPCHPEDQLRCANLVSAADGTVLIPALGANDGSPAEQMLATPLGLRQLGARGIKLDPATVAALQWAATSSAHYGGYTPAPQFILQRSDTQFMPPYGLISCADFSPRDGTWFHHGAPNNPQHWLGGDPSQYGPSVVNPPETSVRGAWQTPITSAWVQQHTVAGVAYVDIIYTCFLAWNGSISLLPGQGEHPNDVETFMVRLKASDLNNPVRYFFQQHGGFAWYDPSHVEKTGDRVNVYLARQSHECYPHPGRHVRLYGFADDVCDAYGVTWDARAVCLDRPQGIDQYGVDTDSLRASFTTADPNDVLLVPVDDPGPLWQYVRFRFIARRPDDIPVSTEAFLHQPFPLSTTKWWPEEGPAGSAPPCSAIAAEAGAPGMTPAFFLYASAYLGPDPLPGRNAAASAATPAKRPMAIDHVAYEPTTEDTIPGSAIGGGTAVLAPNATFVNWRGAIGCYLLAGLNTQVNNWVKLLPDPVTVDTLTVGGVTVRQLVIHGLHQLQVAPAAAISTDSIQVFADTPQLSFSGTVSVAGGPQDIALSAVVNSFAVQLVVQMITPVAVPQSDARQWYVPYVGPSPYSYATAPFATTQAINSARAITLSLTYSSIAVDTGNPVMDKAIDLILQALRRTLEQQAATALMDAVNGLLVSVFDGTVRVG